MYEKKLKVLIIFLLLAKANTYSIKSDEDKDGLFYDISYNDISDNYLSSDKRTPSIYVIRRACIRRNGICDQRPHDCCHSSSCRCNLWGSNCRCQRVGLFQKWG